MISGEWRVASPWSVACLLLTLMLTGCHPPLKPVEPGYFGPTESFDEIIREINANNAPLSTLRATGSFQADLKQGAKSQHVDGQVTLLYSRAHSLRVIGKKDIFGTIFEIASNDQKYWLIVHPPDGKNSTIWYGTYARLAQANPKEIPVRPDLLLQVLGVASIDQNLLNSPAPVMRFDNESDAYVVLWNEKSDDRWLVQKEVWYDRQTLLPKRIDLFDRNGRIVLRADLTNYRSVEVAGIPRIDWPKMATRFDLAFPDTGSRMQLDLSDDLALKRNKAPNAHSFDFPDVSTFDQQIYLDRPEANQ